MQLLQGQQDDNEDFTVSMKDFNGHKSFWWNWWFKGSVNDDFVFHCNAFQLLFFCLSLICSSNLSANWCCESI